VPILLGVRIRPIWPCRGLASRWQAVMREMVASDSAGLSQVYAKIEGKGPEQATRGILSTRCGNTSSGLSRSDSIPYVDPRPPFAHRDGSADSGHPPLSRPMIGQLEARSATCPPSDAQCASPRGMPTRITEITTFGASTFGPARRPADALSHRGALAGRGYAAAVRTVIVQAPDNTSWRVRVVWEPRWRAMARRYGGWRRHRQDDSSGASGLPDLSGVDIPVARSGGGGFWNDLGDDILVGIAVIVGVIVFGLLFWWLLLPLLLLILDAVAVVVLLAAGIAGRVLFRRPWTVQASGGPEAARIAVRVIGWRAALRARDEMAGRLRAGDPPADVVLRYAS
jgi:hypothetical protein